MNIPMSDQERYTILAALQLYLDQGMDDPGNRPNHIHLLAINAKNLDEDGSVVSLDNNGFYALIDRLQKGIRPLITHLDPEKRTIWFYGSEELVNSITEIFEKGGRFSLVNPGPYYYRILAEDDAAFNLMVHHIRRYERGKVE